MKQVKSADWQQKRAMTSGEYALALFNLGLSKAAAARYLGISVRTSYRYYDGITVVPTAHALLLRSLLHHGEVPLVPRP